MTEQKTHLEIEEGKLADGELTDSELNAALRDFRSSVHAWAAAEFARPRTVKAAAPKQVWRTATGWALGCVLAVGAASGAVFEHGRQVEQARAAAAARQAEMARAAAAKKAAAEDPDALLANVNSDLSREVPVALDPLAGVVDSADEQ